MKQLKRVLSAALLVGLGAASSSYGYHNNCNTCYNPNPCCDMDSWYVGATGSAAWHNKVKFSDAGNVVDVKFKTGWGASAFVGYQIDQFRIELEGLYRKNKIKTASRNNPVVFAGPTPPAGNYNLIGMDGHNQDTAIMLNLVFDIPIHCDFGAYIGAGLGISFNEYKIKSATLQSGVNAPVVLTPDQVFGGDGKTTRRDELFAWQVMAGLRYKFTNSFEVFTGYRLFATGKISTPTAAIKSKDIPLTHSVDVGIRFMF